MFQYLFSNMFKSTKHDITALPELMQNTIFRYLTLNKSSCKSFHLFLLFDFIPLVLMVTSAMFFMCPAIPLLSYYLFYLNNDALKFTFFPRFSNGEWKRE